MSAQGENSFPFSPSQILIDSSVVVFNLFIFFDLRCGLLLLLLLLFLFSIFLRVLKFIFVQFVQQFLCCIQLYSIYFKNFKYIFYLLLLFLLFFIYLKYNLFYNTLFFSSVLHYCKGYLLIKYPQDFVRYFVNNIYTQERDRQRDRDQPCFLVAQVKIVV